MGNGVWCVCLMEWLGPIRAVEGGRGFLDYTSERRTRPLTKCRHSGDVMSPKFVFVFFFSNWYKDTLVGPITFLVFFFFCCLLWGVPQKEMTEIIQQQTFLFLFHRSTYGWRRWTPSWSLPSSRRRRASSCSIRWSRRSVFERFGFLASSTQTARIIPPGSSSIKR